MAAFKSILKLQFSNYNKHSYAYRKLKVIQKTINKHIEQSKIKTSSFLN